MLNIAPALYGQSTKYIQVWLYIFTCIAREEPIIISNIINQCMITRQSLYDIINRGVIVFNQHNISLTINRIHPKDKTLIIQCSSLTKSSIKEKPLTTTNNQSNEINQPKKAKSINNQHELAINVIITYLNEATNKQYRTDNQTTIRLINARLNNGFTIEQFKYVIDVKVAHWKDSEFDKYLRPETLFGNKFEAYLNETIITNKPNDNLTQRIRNAEESINRDWNI
jgi:uncharacterized phage protein (TIGR02220 family)